MKPEEQRAKELEEAAALKSFYWQSGILVVVVSALLWIMGTLEYLGNAHLETIYRVGVH